MRMEAINLTQGACVVIANAHNPSILNHDWLIRNELIPEGGWAFAEPPITTLPLSRICYQNNVELHLDSDRLTVRVSQLQTPTAADPYVTIRDIAVSYVNTLPHIPYVAVGNNFEALIECPHVKRTLVEQFGGRGVWVRDLDDVSVRLVYPIDGGTRSVRVVAATTSKAEDDVSEVTDVLLVSGNYHRTTDTKDDTVDALRRGVDDCADFAAFANDLAEDIGHV